MPTAMTERKDMGFPVPRPAGKIQAGVATPRYSEPNILGSPLP